MKPLNEDNRHRLQSVRYGMLHKLLIVKYERRERYTEVEQKLIVLDFFRSTYVFRVNSNSTVN